ncbi:MAG TPA: transglutaminase domain-containing protein [Bacteroidia bacterium]
MKMLSRFTRILFTTLAIFSFGTGLPAQESDLQSVRTEVKTTGRKTNDPSYSAADQHALSLNKKYKKITELAADLGDPFPAKDEKLRSIFIWITDNIAYDCAEFHTKSAQRVSFSYRSAAELEAKRKKFYHEYASEVLRTKRGICEGYAVLFQELCLANGIPCEIVIGVASENTSKIGKLKDKKNFATNHAWVKVKLENAWYHIDPTWASGYCDRPVRRFYKSFNPDYYLTPEDKLYPTHAVNPKETQMRNSILAKR